MSSLKYDQLSADKLAFTKPEENDRCRGQFVGYPIYDEEQSSFAFVTPWLNYFHGGTPKESEFYTGTGRHFWRLPFPETLEHFGKEENMSDEQKAHYKKLINESTKMREILQSIDEKFDTDEMRNEMYGSKGSKYSYSPIVKELDDDDATKKGYKYYMRLKLGVEYQGEKMVTTVSKYTSGTEFKPKRSAEDKAAGSVAYDDIDQFIENVPFRSMYRAMIEVNKTWAHPPKNKNPEYGITLKLVDLCVVPRKSSGAKKNYGYDSDSDEDEVSGDDEQVFQKEEPAADSASEESAASTSGSDSEDEAPPPPKAKAKKTPTKSLKAKA
jgi:hypothetical protein